MGSWREGVNCIASTAWDWRSGVCHLHLCGGFSDFLVIRVLKAQQFNTQAIKWPLLVCFCYVYVMEFEQKPRGFTPKPRPFGRMEVRWNTINRFDRYRNALAWSRLWGGGNFFTSLFAWRTSWNVKSFLRRISVAIIYRQCQTRTSNLTAEKHVRSPMMTTLHVCIINAVLILHDLVCFGKAKKISMFQILNIFCVDWPSQLKFFGSSFVCVVRLGTNIGMNRSWRSGWKNKMVLRVFVIS